MDRRLRISLLILASFSFLLIFFPFYREVLLAAVFAFALDPLSRRAAKSALLRNSAIYFRRKQWVAITLSLLILSVTVPIIIATYNVYSTIQTAANAGFQNSQFYQDVDHLRELVLNYYSKLEIRFGFKHQFDIAAISNKFIGNLGELLLTYSGRILATLPQIILHIFIFCCALYFFLAENRQLKAAVLRSGFIQPEELGRLVLIFQKSCSSTLFASVVTGVVQASIVGAGSLLLKTGDFFVIFVITFFLSFIPVIGAAPVALFLGLLALIKLSYLTAFGFLIIALIAGSIDNVVRPYLVGSGEDVHPVIVLIGIIGSIAIFGLPGLFLGPVITSVTAKLYGTYILKGPDEIV